MEGMETMEGMEIIKNIEIMDETNYGNALELWRKCFDIVVNHIPNV